MRKNRFVFILLALSVFISLSNQCKVKKEVSSTTEPKTTIILYPTINEEYFPTESLTYKILDAKVENKILIMDLSYTGGCGTHQFELIWNGRYLKSYPIQIPLHLKHEIKDENCEKLILTTLKYDISGILPKEEDTVLLKISGYEKKVECII